MKRIIAIILGSIVVLTLLTACGDRDHSEAADTAIYYMNGDKTGVESEKYEITETNSQKAVEQMIQEMSKKSTDVNRNPAIPKGVKVLSCALEYKNVLLNFSKEYAKLSPVEQTLSRAAIVDSLVQIQGVEGVSFQVEGTPMTNKDGQEIGILNGDSFVQNVGSMLSTYQTATLHLFYANGSGDGLHMETKDVKYSSNISLEKLIMNQLLKGPSGIGDYQTINPDTTILGVTLRDGICYVNLDDVFLQNVIDVQPEIAIYSIVNSLVDGTNVESVQISVNGENNIKYMDVVDLSQPLKKNSKYIIK